MAYDFRQVRNPVLKRLFDTIFSITSGHDHDGVNSKLVTTGTPADNAVTTAKIAAGALAATAAGRGKIANNFFDAATVLAKFAADAFDSTVLTIFKDGFLPLVKMSPTARYKIFTYQVEDLAAGADIANRVLMIAPTGLNCTLVSIGVIPMGASAGVDDANTAVFAFTDGTNTIVSKTYNTATQPPASGAIGDLGALDATHKILTPGEKLTFSLTQGATANLPGLMIQIVYDVTDAA